MLYVDYGTIDYVCSDSFCFLSQYHSTYPVQAFRGCINNIRSNADNTQWEHGARSAFNKKTARKLVEAKLMAIDIEVLF